tara:strand:- start:56 stop:1210 length:1155 start_codon:yes stop_codon:yes gene_type:complete
MKKILILSALTISFSMNAQGYQYNTTVENWGSAFGGGTTANGWHSFAINYETQATNNNTLASGYQSIASGDTSTALGFLSQASGLRSVAIGSYATASNNVSVAIGHNITASGSHSLGLGVSTNATGSYSTAMGATTTASGDVSTTMGTETIAADWASLVIGQYNSSGSSATSANSFSTSAPAFVIGNGIDGSNRSDAFKVLFNGNTTLTGDLTITGNDISSSSTTAITLSGSNVTTLGDLTVTGNDINFGNGETISNGIDETISLNASTTSLSNDLTVGGDVNISSDARLKSNIVSLGATLSKLLLIDGKSYEKDGKQRIGVLAQEIQEVFPELVTEDGNEMLAVNYQGLVPVLINALKEQAKIIKSQEARLTNIENLIANLNE